MSSDGRVRSTSVVFPLLLIGFGALLLMRRLLPYFDPWPVLWRYWPLLLILVGGILPTYWRLSDDLSALPNLQRDLAATEADYNLLHTNLQALAAEARRQVRWAELLTAFSAGLRPK